MQPNETKKKESSIVRSIFFLWLRKLAGIFLATDLFVAVLCGGGWLYYQEETLLGAFDFGTSIEVDSETHTLLLTNESGETAIADPMPEAPLFGYGMLALCGMQALSFLGAICFDSFRIRKRLKPLRDIASTAQVLASQTWDTQKFQNLEYAISHVDADSPNAHIHTQDRDLAGIEASLNDLLDRMREANLQQVRFVSDASHELRTPIAVIKGYVDMLDRWGKEDIQILEEGISAIKQESDHMNTLVEQLLFLARGDSGRNHMQLEQFPLSSMVREVFEESRMIDSRHTYEFEDTAADILCFGDSAMLKQSMRILIDNAAKYTTEGDTISIRVGVTPEYRPFLSVQDNGIGMSDSDVVHIFDRFYRSDKARNGSTGGTGLGLSIAKWIIDRHHGAIQVISRPDIGTRFTILLNVNKEQYDNAVRI